MPQPDKRKDFTNAAEELGDLVSLPPDLRQYNEADWSTSSLPTLAGAPGFTLEDVIRAHAVGVRL